MSTEVVNRSTHWRRLGLAICAGAACLVLALLLMGELLPHSASKSTAAASSDPPSLPAELNARFETDARLNTPQSAATYWRAKWLSNSGKQRGVCVVVVRPSASQ